MPWGAAIGPIIGAVGAIGGGLIAAHGSKSAADTSSNAQLAAAQLQAQQKQPWVDAGKVGLHQLQTGLAPGGEFSQKFSMADAVNSPAEQFALQQGTQAINNSNAARSGTLNTNATQDVVKFAQGNAAQFENQAYNQWLGQQQLKLGATESLAGTGQTAAMSSADATASLMAGAGATQAAGQVGAANAWSGAFGNSMNSIQQQMMLSKLLGQNSNTAGSNQFGGSPNFSSFGGDPYASAGEYDSNMQFSDERLKEDKKHVGYTMHGTPIYTYRMKHGDKRTKMGVMAQDIEDADPTAVKTHETGFKMVDYSKVH